MSLPRRTPLKPHASPPPDGSEQTQEGDGDRAAQAADGIYRGALVGREATTRPVIPRKRSPHKKGPPEVNSSAL